MPLFIPQNHNGPSAGVIPVLVTLIRTNGSLKSTRYISVVLRSLAVPFTQTLRNSTFRRDNDRQHVATIFRTFLDVEESIRLLP